MAIRQRLTYDSWFSKYQPVQNPFHDYGCNGTLFETTEKELAVVRTADPQRVWTRTGSDILSAAVRLLQKTWTGTSLSEHLRQHIDSARDFSRGSHLRGFNAHT